MYAPSQTWDIDRFFPGGPTGEAFSGELATMQAQGRMLVVRADALPPLSSAEHGAWSALLLDTVAADDRVSQLTAYSGCAEAADTRSTEVQRAATLAEELYTTLERAAVPVDAHLAAASDADFHRLCERPELADLVPRLIHRRAGTRLKLPRALQEVVVELDRDGLHGWGQLYDHVSGPLEGTLRVPGEPEKRLGIAAVHGLRAHSSEPVRKAAHEAAQEAWGSVAIPCAAALTHITGTRQVRFDRVGVDEIASSLHSNRVSRTTLEAMWAACDEVRGALVSYLDRKAALLGKARLDWWDLAAPVGGQSKEIEWEPAQALVVDAFGGYDPALRDFAVRALTDRWIEAEERPGKKQGGFCTEMPLSRESRIFLTFSRSIDSTLTLAHELGHAYHNEVLFDAPPARRNVPSALAETASTFAEAVLRDRALKSAANDGVRVALLDQELQAAVAFLMNIRARYAFERELFRLRREGPLSPELLTSAMVACQKHAHAEALGSWDSTFWASKLHFYISHFGFYNWPYTFGYLFSGAVYARAAAEGPSFAPTYRKLLMMTGWASAEQIGREVLGEDLHEVDFWRRALAPVLGNVDQFLAKTA